MSLSRERKIVAQEINLKEPLKLIPFVGFTALFGAPLGGSLISLEILHHKYVVEYYQALIPAFVASCASYVVFIFINHLGIGSVWIFPSYSAEGVMDFFYDMAYASVAASFGWLFIAPKTLA